MGGAARCWRRASSAAAAGPSGSGQRTRSPATPAPLPWRPPPPTPHRAAPTTPPATSAQGFSSLIWTSASPCIRSGAPHLFNAPQPSFGHPQTPRMQRIMPGQRTRPHFRAPTGRHCSTAAQPRRVARGIGWKPASFLAGMSARLSPRATPCESARCSGGESPAMCKRCPCATGSSASHDMRVIHHGAWECCDDG